MTLKNNDYEHAPSITLLFGSVVMYTSCQSTSAPIDSLAARVTENTSKDQILFRLVTDETDPAKTTLR